MKKINVTYFDNNDINFDEWVDSYKEYKAECGEDINEMVTDGVVFEQKVWDYIYWNLDQDWEDFFTNLNFSTNSDIPCVIVGSVSRWTGRHNIHPVGCDDIATAIHKCIKNMDYVSIKQNGGHLEVVGIHHDGRDTFDIYLLNDKGVDALYRIKDGFGNADLGKRCYHKALKGYLF